eukprot:CAMPEP_0116018504 /NCGR_PEP_ID=MMETSP0321-20121206/8686_1 /TAXON_ID=163516 /ORGANISM="Leptocylindrus danicus var. danicus, Strain B650" /LENGTH=241 /DNA_ID=CAMNT_0003488907 /DNA_START=341 /DNA_END=1068 /DNA_ORIENTATION=-
MIPSISFPVSTRYYSQAIDRVSKQLRSEFAKGDGRVKRNQDHRRSGGEIEPCDTLFVVNYHVDRTRREDLEMLFKDYGRLVRVDMRRNYAFVQFESTEEALKAKNATDGGKLDDSVLSVEFTEASVETGAEGADLPNAAVEVMDAMMIVGAVTMIAGGIAVVAAVLTTVAVTGAVLAAPGGADLGLVLGVTSATVITAGGAGATTGGGITIGKGLAGVTEEGSALMIVAMAHVGLRVAVVF